MKLYGEWSVTLPDEKHMWRPDETTLGEWLMLQTELGGMTFDGWVEGIDARDPIPCQVLVWFLRRLDGDVATERMAVDFPIRRLELERLTDPAVALEVDVPEASAGSEPADS